MVWTKTLRLIPAIPLIICAAACVEFATAFVTLCSWYFRLVRLNEIADYTDKWFDSLNSSHHHPIE